MIAAEIQDWRDGEQRFVRMGHLRMSLFFYVESMV